MKQEDRDRIWNRGSARDIMRLARQQFREAIKNELQTEAHTALASAHYSLIKRYKKRDPRALWHAFAAAMHARDAIGFGLKTFEQADVCTTILSKVPRPFGSLKKAYRIVVSALEYSPASESEEIIPHTRALLLIRRAEIEMKLGKQPYMVEVYYDQARKLMPEVTDERQKCRILSAVGFYQHDSFGANRGWKLIVAALSIAHRVSKDQYEKILTEASKRRMNTELLLVDARVKPEPGVVRFI